MEKNTFLTKPWCSIFMVHQFHRLKEKYLPSWERSHIPQGRHFWVDDDFSPVRWDMCSFLGRQPHPGLPARPCETPSLHMISSLLRFTLLPPWTSLRPLGTCWGLHTTPPDSRAVVAIWEFVALTSLAVQRTPWQSLSKNEGFNEGLLKGQ